jgi:hypothetical protein
LDLPSSNTSLFPWSDQITKVESCLAVGIGELEDHMYIKGLEDWPTIGEEEKIVCLNCFRSTHATEECEYIKATVISESPLKEVEIENHGAKQERILTVANRDTDTILDGELNDDDLNEAYDELLTQEFNPDAEDFEEDIEDAFDEKKSS